MADQTWIAGIETPFAPVAEIDRLRAEVAALKAALSAQDPAVSELVRASDAAHGKVVALEAEVAALKAALGEAKDALNEISWQNAAGTEWPQDRAKAALARIDPLLGEAPPHPDDPSQW